MVIFLNRHHVDFPLDFHWELDPFRLPNNWGQMTSFLKDLLETIVKFKLEAETHESFSRKL